MWQGFFEQVLEERAATGFGGRWYGVYPALVSDIRDPENQGRVKITLPWAPDTGGAAYETWARLAVLMGGNDRGTWFVPDVDDEVLVAFEGGDPDRPYVLGGLWNGRDRAPETMDGAGRNNKKVIRSRRGVKITLDDSDGTERLQLETPRGQKITLQDGPPGVRIEDSNGNSIRMEASGVTITTSARLKITASVVEISSPIVTVDAGTSQFSGMVRSDVCISNTVISTTYTPGAGNIW